jgi:methylenetetrahydrofolate reductase (NADPH)
MTIADLLAGADRPTFSFEFFPPRDDAGEEQLWQTIQQLEPLGPDFVSVTYGANGSRRDRTLGVTQRLATQTGLRTMGHLTCVDQPRQDLIEVIDRYAQAGVGHILAIRGDMPGGPTLPWHPHPDGLANATQLVELIVSRGDFCVGVAAFPDPHPAQYDPALDARLLKDKWSAGAAFAITQLFFATRAYVELVDRVRALGCPIPIIPGIMPITQVSQVMTFAQLSGAVMPPAVTDRLDQAGDDPAAVRREGIAIAADLAAELLAAGAPGLHFFTQNRSTATMAIWDQVRPRG